MIIITKDHHYHNYHNHPECSDYNNIIISSLSPKSIKNPQFAMTITWYTHHRHHHHHHHHQRDDEGGSPPDRISSCA